MNMELNRRRHEAVGPWSCIRVRGPTQERLFCLTSARRSRLRGSIEKGVVEFLLTGVSHLCADKTTRKKLNGLKCSCPGRQDKQVHLSPALAFGEMRREERGRLDPRTVSLPGAPRPPRRSHWRRLHARELFASASCTMTAPPWAYVPVELAGTKLS